MRLPPVLLPACLLLCAGCGAVSTEAPAEEARGAELYVSWNCAACHGEAGQGTEFGPSLLHVARVWDVAGLTAHLGDPERMRARDPRLRALAERFPARMPGYAEPEQDRRVLASWLLTRNAAP